MSNKISILIFTCNRPADLRRCLDSVFNQTYKDFEVVVIDNGNSSETDSLISNYNVKVVKDGTKRLSYLFNLGWKSVNNELLVYLADDVEIANDWVEESIKSMSRNSRAAVVTGPLVSPFEYTGEMHALYVKSGSNPLLKLAAKVYHNFILDGKTFEPCVLCESGSYTLGQGFLPDFKEEREVDLATTSSMMVRRSAISAVGGFDENFMFNHADGDLFVRFRKQGYSIVYNPKVRGVHYVRFGPSRYPFIIGRDTAFFYLKDIRPKTIRGFITALANILVLNLYWIYRAVQTKDARQLKGILGFLKGIFDFIRLRFNI